MVHLESHVGLHFLQSLGVDELCEWIQLELVKQSQEIVTEPSHLTVSVCQHIFQNHWNKCGLELRILLCLSGPKTGSPLYIFIFSTPVLLSLRFGEGTLSHRLLVKENNKRGLRVTLILIARILDKQSWHLINLDQYVGEKEFTAVIWDLKFGHVPTINSHDVRISIVLISLPWGRKLLDLLPSGFDNRFEAVHNEGVNERAVEIVKLFGRTSGEIPSKAYAHFLCIS